MTLTGQWIGEPGKTKKGKYICKFLTSCGNLVAVMSDSPDVFQSDVVDVRLPDGQLVFAK